MLIDNFFHICQFLCTAKMLSCNFRTNGLMNSLIRHGCAVPPSPLRGKLIACGQFSSKKPKALPWEGRVPRRGG